MAKRKSKAAQLGDEPAAAAVMAPADSANGSTPDCFDDAIAYSQQRPSAPQNEPSTPAPQVSEQPATPSAEPVPAEVLAYEREVSQLKPMTAEELRGEAPSTSVTPSEVQASGLLPADLPKRNPGSRPWATRYAPPEVKYDVVAKKNAKGAPTLFIKFHGIKDGEKPTPEILAVMQGHKTTPEGYRTGLRFEHDPIEGKGWQLPDTPEGRDVLWSIERGLDKLAHKIASEQGWER
jgi:hypothetical protein